METTTGEMGMETQTAAIHDRLHEMAMATRGQPNRSTLVALFGRWDSIRAMPKETRPQRREYTKAVTAFAGILGVCEAKCTGLADRFTLTGEG
jgi:hypothetical protein